MKFSLFVILCIFAIGNKPVFSQGSFSQGNATEILYHLAVEIGPRPMGSRAEFDAMMYATQKFYEYGCDSIYIMPMLHSSTKNTNSGIAVGIKRGITDRIIIIGGHIDSAEPEVPGADDDGSGAATVIELARVFGHRQMQSTLVFCCFGGEEQGLEGSRYFANHFPDMDKVVLMLQTDMANGLGTIDIDPDVHGISAPRWLVKAAVEEFYKLGYEHLEYPTFFFAFNYEMPEGAGSDHEPFLLKGIPSLDFSTDVNKPIHTPRDNFENFDPRGLKRSGDLVERLVERFDAGTPDRTTENYMLFLVGQTPVFFPIWSIQLLIGISFAFILVAWFIARKRMLPWKSLSARMSPLKILLFSFLIISFGWFAVDIVGFLKGVRHPWMAQIELYYYLGALGIVAGALSSIWLTRLFHISECPYRHFRYSVLILILLMVASMYIGTKFAALRAPALIFMSLAFIVRKPALKLFFFFLSPWWFTTIVFSEWGPMIFKSLSYALPGTLMATTIYNGVVVLLLTGLLLPFSFGFAGIIRDMPESDTIKRFLKSKGTLAFAILSFGMFILFLIPLPSYSSLWYRDLKPTLHYRLDKDSSAFTIRSSEYLKNVQVTMNGMKTLLQKRSTSAEFPPPPLDTSLVAISRIENTTSHGDTTGYNITLNINTKKTPYTVAITYSSDSGKPTNIITSLNFYTRENERRLEWYSFPDMPIVAPVHFEIIGNKKVREKITVTFCELPEGILIQGPQCFVIPRTEIVEEHWYKRN